MRIRPLYDPVYQPTLTDTEKKDLLTERIPAAAVAAAVPIGLLMRRLPGGKQLKRIGAAMGLGAASSAGGFLAVRTVKNIAARQQQKKALNLSPLKPGETLQMGPEGKRGVWRTLGKNSVFIQVKPRESVPQAIRRTENKYSVEGHEAHIEQALPLRPRKVKGQGLLANRSRLWRWG